MMVLLWTFLSYHCGIETLYVYDAATTWVDAQEFSVCAANQHISVATSASYATIL